MQADTAQPAVWVTRPADGGRVTARALRAAGYCVVQAPLLEVALLPPQPPPPASWPDLVILVSANAARGLVAARQEAPPPGTRVAAVGRRTAEEAGRLGFSVDRVPRNESAVGLLELLAAERLDGKRVWIPAGNREGSATVDLPQALRDAGAAVDVFQVYETRARRLAPAHLAQLDAAVPGAVVLHSPSAAEALFDDRPAAVRRWRERAVPVAIGARTRSHLTSLGAENVEECAAPSDAGVIATLASLPFLKPRI